MARDKFHDLVRAGLEAEGWNVTNDPYRLKLAPVRFEIDLAAEKIIAATKDNLKIAVEIKSFLNASLNADFYSALGQFLSYRLVIEELDPERKLYLALPEDIYNDDFFQSRFLDLAITKYQLSLLVYNSQTGGLSQWIN
jgi:hypothetical protein